jgi:serine/threonine-protein kinase
MLVERNGDPDFIKVCDFGLAKDIERDSYDPVQEADLALAVDLDSITTEHGHICGTPEYMAPEQARGERVDERADLYAIAVMLYQAVVGRPPFSARSPLAVVSLHLTAAPPRPSELRPDLGIFPPLESLILRGLAKDRTERPSSADVFALDLARIERDFARWSKKHGAHPRPSLAVESATLSLAPKAAAPNDRARKLVMLAASFCAAALTLAALVRGTGTSAAATRQARASVSAPTPGAARPLVPHARDVPVASPAPTAAPATVATAPPIPSHEASAIRARSPSSASGALLARANEALLQGRIQEACSLGEKASASQGSSPRVWKFLGQCFMRLGAREKGIAYYQRYLELSPSGPDAVFVREMIK